MQGVVVGERLELPAPVRQTLLAAWRRVERSMLHRRGHLWWTAQLFLRPAQARWAATLLLRRRVRILLHTCALIESRIRFARSRAQLATLASRSRHGVEAGDKSQRRASAEVASAVLRVPCMCGASESCACSCASAVYGYGYGYILGPSPVPPIYLAGSFGLVLVMVMVMLLNSACTGPAYLAGSMVMVMVMVLFSALVRSHQSTSLGVQSSPRTNSVT